MKSDKYFEDLESKGYYDSLDKRTKEYKEYKEWLAKKAEVQYEEVKANIDKENTVGLGDVVEKVTRATGVKKVVEAITDDCGCDERKDKFNKFVLWKRRKVNCIKQDDYVWIKDLLKRRPSRYTFEMRERLVRIHNEVLNTKHKNTKCVPCMKGLLENMQSYLDVWEN